MNIEEHSRQAGHETTDVSIRPIVKFLVALTVGLIVVGVVLGLLFGFLSHKQGAVPSVVSGPRELPPQPRLQTVPAADLQQLRSRENEALNGYAWVDQKAGLVRIPIDRAIDLIAQQGLPYRRTSTQDAKRTQAAKPGEAAKSTEAAKPNEGVKPEEAAPPKGEVKK
jgi:hypothetical protein